MKRNTSEEIIAIERHYQTGGALEAWDGREWLPVDNMKHNYADRTYRIKPKPLEGWAVIYQSGFIEVEHSEATSRKSAGKCGARAFKWREVLDE